MTSQPLVDAHPAASRRVRRGSLAACGVLAGAIVSVAGCNREKPPQMAFPTPVVAVATSKAEDVPVYLDEIGRCSALESVTITPRIAGQITQRHFEDGAELKKGQLLFTVDPQPFQAALAAAEAQQAQAKAAMDFANIELQRYTVVANSKAISKSDFDTKKNAVDVASAQAAAAEAAVTAAKLNLDFCSIKSPIDGRAGARLVDVGNVVKSNEGALLVIQHLDPIYADFTVNEGELARVRENMSHGTLKTLVRLPTDAGPSHTGELTFLDNAIQDATGTVKLRATLPNTDLHFWPGQFINVRLVLRVQKDAVLVPSPAPQLGQQGQYVFVVKDDMTAEQRPVIVGQRQGDWVVLDKGVKAGERVITDGQITVRAGGKVRLEAPATAPSSVATVGGEK